jgi:hypothetical protein
MPMKYMVRFTGYLDELKRPKHIPSEVYHDVFFTVENDEELRGYIKQMYTIFVSQHCMIVPKDPNQIQEEGNFIYDNSILVPIHMLTYIGTKTRQVVGDIPIIGEDNIARMSDGSKASIQ